MLVPTTQVTGGANAVRPVNSFSSSSSSEDLHGKGKGKLSPHNSKDQTNLQSLVDAAQLDAGKQALKELLKERKTKKSKKTSCASLLKLYTTILAGLMIIGGLFTLLFLVPMTIDPALATLTYEFHPKPVLCMTTFADWISGLTSIDWCSCTEGCTSDIYNCSQVTVVYKDCLKKENIAMTNISIEGKGECSLADNSTGPNNETTNTTYIDPGYWDVLNASLYINVKGCGYPPWVNCTTFFDRYGVPGRRFWCYYSKMDPYLVMPDYDPQAAELELVKSLGWTIGAQIVGILIIVVLHCPYIAFLKNTCRRRTVLQPQSMGGVVNHGATNSMSSLVAAWKDKDKPRQPVFQRDWYDVHT